VVTAGNAVNRVQNVTAGLPGFFDDGLKGFFAFVQDNAVDVGGGLKE
jgi:hypothetical protein